MAEGDGGGQGLDVESVLQRKLKWKARACVAVLSDCQCEFAWFIRFFVRTQQKARAKSARATKSRRWTVAGFAKRPRIAEIKLVEAVRSRIADSSVNLAKTARSRLLGV
jgi:hypothetical protein